MIEYDVKRTVKIYLDADEDQKEKLFDFLVGIFKSTCDLDEEGTTQGSYVITISQIGVEKCYPGCYTLPNGDPGYPDEYEDNLDLYDSVVEEYLEKYRNTLEDPNEFNYTVDQDDERI